MTERRMIDADITDRADGKVPVWDAATATHIYETIAAGDLPGHEYDYAELTGAVSIVATTEAGATTVLTGNAVVYNGSTIVMIEFYTPLITWAPNDNTRFALYDGAASIGEISRFTFAAATPSVQSPGLFRRRLTPSAASHTYSIRAWRAGAGASNVNGGAGGSGALVPAFIRITRA